MPAVLPLPAGFGLAVNLDTGEVERRVSGKVELDQFARLAEQYMGRTAARKLLARFRVTKGTFEVPAYRVVRCGLAVKDEKSGVSLFRAMAAQRAHFGGLLTCGSVWHCPVCSRKVAARRAAEMIKATDACVESGGRVGLLTCTVKHTESDDCLVSLERLQRLFDKLNAGRAGRDWRERFGVIGQIRAIEFTCGSNGWHPHVHALVFSERQVDWADARECLLSRYKVAAAREFGWELAEAAVDLRGGDAAARYVAGWGVEAEVAGGAWKRGKKGSAPFDLLLTCLNHELEPTDRREAGEKFVNYATAVSQVKDGRVTSTRQLVWSRGLKERFGVETLTDEEIAERLEEPSLLLGQLTFEDWRKVINVRSVDARLIVLQLASMGGWPDVKKFVDSLPEPDGSFSQTATD